LIEIGGAEQQLASSSGRLESRSEAEKQPVAKPRRGRVGGRQGHSESL
jgi:hypothetical protein